MAENDIDSVLEGVGLLIPHALEIGTYVAFQLDPVRSLETLHDPEVDLAARQLEPQMYVGLVSNIWLWPDEDRPLFKVKLSLVSEALPPRIVDSAETDAMGTPIFPTTEHPMGRQPLHPSKPLPWPICYQRSSLSTLMTVSSIDRRCPSGITLSDADVARHTEYVDSDLLVRRKILRYLAREERKEAEEAAAASKATDELQTPVLEPVEQDLSSPPEDARSEFYVHGSEVATSDNHNAEDDISETPSGRPGFHLFDLLPPGHIEITGKVYLDLSLVPTLPDGVNYFREVRAIHQLQDESLERWKNEMKKSQKESQVANWLDKTGDPGPTATAPPDDEAETSHGRRKRRCFKLPLQVSVIIKSARFRISTLSLRLKRHFTSALMLHRKKKGTVPSDAPPS